ncbi:MAG: NAD(P)H-hydrate dehydratase [Flavobacterium sp.]
MKIFGVEKIREADEITILRQGITSYELMERAGNEAFLWIKHSYPDKETCFRVFCGSGNNGGDGLVVARLLHEDGYRVKVHVVGGNASPDNKISMQSAVDKDVKILKYLSLDDDDCEKTIIIDALLGTGISREPEGNYMEIIELINNSKSTVISIDVPSGLFLNRPTKLAVKSNIVLTFQFPKFAFYLSRNYDFFNTVEVLDIGLDKNFISTENSDIIFVDKKEANSRYRPVPFFAHKGTQGHALIIGGSYGKIGAITLTAKAALKAGSGLVTAYIPECGYNILQTAVPEAMALTNGEKYISQVAFDLKPTVIGIGPGMGHNDETQRAMHELLQKQTAPMVIDADALNILAANKDWLQDVPENSVLTPHPKELQRLIGEWTDDFEKTEMVKTFSKQHKLVVVMKDARTMIVYEDKVYVNSTGNSGLATGGSGDVLTGIITGLISQGYNSIDAAVFGVYLHGLTADIGVQDVGKQSFTASSIIDYLGKAFLQVESECL